MDTSQSARQSPDVFKTRRGRIIVPIVTAAFLALVAQTPASVAAPAKTTSLPIVTDGNASLVSVTEFAKALGWEAKEVTPGKLVTLCKGDLCVPLQLQEIKHKKVNGKLHADATALAKALKASFKREGNRAVFSPNATDTTDGSSSVPAYNAAWGKGRGFRKGQTVPDIPLYDLDGKEVRFSAFLGKQYLIYIWSSW